MDGVSVYLAAPYHARDILRHWRDDLFTPTGIEVTSQWLEEPHALDVEPAELTHDQCVEYAKLDLADIDRADHFVGFSCAKDGGVFKNNNRGARHVEFGYAKAWGKVLWYVGPRENMMHYLVPDWRVLDNVYNVVECLQAWGSAAAEAAGEYAVEERGS